MEELTIMRRIAIALVFVVGCSKDIGSSTSTGAAARDNVVAAWKAGGLGVSVMAPVELAFGKDCQSGTVGGVDVAVCAYGSPADAKAAEEPGLAWVGVATGLSQARGSALILAADREKADPNGKLIHQLTKLAPK